jgi:hypothetical protein
MLGRIIGIFIIPFIFYFSIYPMITQEVNNAINCNANYTGNGTLTDILNNQAQNQEPAGKTDSFGGGGSNHFGGYTGEVKHEDFTEKITIYRTNSSIFNPTCTELSESEKSLLSNMPLIFLITMILTSLFMWGNFFHSYNLWGID